MTQQEKELLLKDLCARLPYGVNIQISLTTGDAWGPSMLKGETLDRWSWDNTPHNKLYEGIRPYLRPMSSMTDEERDELFSLTHRGSEEWAFSHNAYVCLDYLNAHHFDYRNLIEKGLALEAPKGMYKI